MEVPCWNMYYPSLSYANKEQKLFYNRLEAALEADEKIDIKENITYIFIYLYKIVYEFIRCQKIDPLLIKFDRIFYFYGSNETISAYTNGWSVDACLYIGDYENAWRYFKKQKYGKFEDMIFIRGKYANASFQGEELLKFFGSDNGLTKFGKINIEHVINQISIFLENFYSENKINYAKHFLKKYNYGLLTKNDLEELRGYYTNDSEFKRLKKDYEKTQNSKYPYPRKYRYGLFAGAPIGTPYTLRDLIPYILSIALHNRIKSIIRESENTVRSENNLPLVGKGRISKTELFLQPTINSSLSGICDAARNIA